MKHIMIFVFSILIIVAVFSINKNKKDTAQLTIGSHVFTVTLADTTRKHEQGLSNTPHLVTNSGMYFVFDTEDTYGFWMKDMLFDLDFIFVRNNSVVHVIQNVPSPGHNKGKTAIVNSPIPFDAVLEVESGNVKKWGIKIGQQVKLDV